MIKKIRYSLFLALTLAILPMAIAAAEEEPKTFYSVSYSGAMVLNKTIEIGIDHRGVKLEAITFSGDEALVVTWNRTPSGVKAHAAIALFDAKNQLVGAESDSRATSIRSGKQGNFKIRFKKFLSDFSGVARFQVVFVIVES